MFRRQGPQSNAPRSKQIEALNPSLHRNRKSSWRRRARDLLPSLLNLRGVKFHQKRRQYVVYQACDYLFDSNANTFQMAKPFKVHKVVVLPGGLVKVNVFSNDECDRY